MTQPGEELITLGECERRGILPMKRTRLWQLASRGELPGAIRIGGRFYVSPRLLLEAAARGSR